MLRLFLRHAVAFGSENTDTSVIDNDTTNSSESQAKKSTRNRTAVLDSATAEDITTEAEGEALLKYQELSMQIRALERESQTADAAAGLINDEDLRQTESEKAYKRMEKLDGLYAERNKLASGKELREVMKRIYGESEKKREARQITMDSVENNRAKLERKLSRAVDALRKTDEKSLRDEDLQKLARSIIKETHATGIPSVELAEELGKIGRVIINGTAEDMTNAEDMALSLADRLIEHSSETVDDMAGERKRVKTTWEGEKIQNLPLHFLKKSNFLFTDE